VFMVCLSFVGLARILAASGRRDTPTLAFEFAAT
jgi:hypothetical protein